MGLEKRVERRLFFSPFLLSFPLDIDLWRGAGGRSDVVHTNKRAEKAAEQTAKRVRAASLCTAGGRGDFG